MIETEPLFDTTLSKAEQTFGTWQKLSTVENNVIQSYPQVKHSLLLVIHTNDNVDYAC